MEIAIKQGDVLNETCDLLVVNMFSGVKTPGGATGILDRALDGWLVKAMEQERFEGREGEWIAFPTFGKLKAKKVAVIGLGERSAFTPDTVRRIGGHVAKRARDAKAKNVTTILHGAGAGGLSAREVASALGEGMRLGAYRFTAYKSKAKGKTGEREAVIRFTICETDRAKVAAAERGLLEAEAVAKATILARDLVNTPSMDMTPARLASAAQDVAAKSRGVSVKILDAAAMRKLGMHASLAVGQGSCAEPVGVHLTYKPQAKHQKAKAKRIAVVGKAVTFDSGGLSLKTAEGMTTMKIDMAGAAAVIGLFSALPALQPNVEVHGIFLAVENMPSGTAYRPGDVVTAMNGKTIEVLNTDAEGRVTLADALSYAARLKPSAIIDLATLTMACIIALGEDVAALLSNDRRLADRLLEAARETGEPLWELPLFQPYQDLVKSRIADLKNTGGRPAGAITAALFLSHFVPDGIAWAHLDMAGPSYAERETRPDQPFGGTGYGVRLLARYLQGVR